MDLTLFIPHLAEWLGVIAVCMILGTVERLKPQQVGYRYPQREAVIALSLFAAIFLINILFFSGQLRLPLAVNPSETSSSLQQRLVMALVAAAVFLLALVVRRQPPRSAGFTDRTNAGMRLGLVLVFLTIFLRGAIFKLTNGLNAGEMSALGIWLVIALAEETVFRGYIQSRLEWFAKPLWGWLITSGLFVLWQLPRLLLDPAGLWLGLAFAAVQGLLLGWIMKRSGHVLAPALYRAVSEWLVYLA
ncbi:MAG: CPBP family intramembrane metalloprotease [Anaerolineae bacterium]|nr:CPBP family intramembrane metalloprotease [Anaerolineae bacterium]